MNLKVAGALLCLVGALAALVPLFTHGTASEADVAAVQRFAPDYFSSTLIWSAAVIVLGLATTYVATRKSAKAALGVAGMATGAAVVRLIQLPGADHAIISFDRLLAIVSVVAFVLGGIAFVVVQARSRQETPGD